jgi:hypothetical protein
MAKKVSWPRRLWHGTSAKGLELLRKAETTKGLYLTDDENTAADYADSSARRDRSEPVMVEINVVALQKQKGTIRYDRSGDVEDILEQLIYKGSLPSNLILKVEKLAKL